MASFAQSLTSVTPLLLADRFEPALPDSPGYLRSTAPELVHESSSLATEDAPFDAGEQGPNLAPGEARKYARTIQPNQQAQTLTAKDKMVFSVANLVRPTAPAGWLFSAGWTHLTDGTPHYGTDSAGFGERLGAAALKQSSQSVLIFGVFASVFHEDPRYYVMGNNQPFKKRLIYAASRVLLTKTDTGSESVNWAQISGIAGSTALTQLYYPDRDTGWERTVRSFGTSFLTGAASNEAREFFADAIRMIRRKK